jgi:hypothetical protein
MPRSCWENDWIHYHCCDTKESFVYLYVNAAMSIYPTFSVEGSYLNVLIITPWKKHKKITHYKLGFCTKCFKARGTCDLLTYGAEHYLRSCQLCSHSGNSQQFERTRRFITVFTRALHWSLSWVSSIQFPPSVTLRRKNNYFLLSVVVDSKRFTTATLIRN